MPTIPTPSTSITITNLLLPQPLHISSLFIPPQTSTPSAQHAHPTSEQPATLTLTLHLARPFLSAASADALDSSTIHYGHLSKRIRAACAADTVRTVESVFDAARGVIVQMAGADAEGGQVKREGLVREAEMEVRVPKGSMGSEDGARVGRWARFEGEKEGGEGGSGSGEEGWRFGVRGSRVQVLIGVNAKERWRRQPVLVTFEIYGEGKTQVPLVCWRVEENLAQILEETAFETLETLIEHTFDRLQRDVFDESLAQTTFKLRLEKPQAIAFADAPAVEIVRPVSTGRKRELDPRVSITERLCIIQPYIA